MVLFVLATQNIDFTTVASPVVLVVVNYTLNRRMGFFDGCMVIVWVIPGVNVFVSDAKYISHSMNITGLEEGILSHFDLEKHPSFIYMLSNIIVLTSFVMILWKKYLVDLIKRSLDQAGVSDERLVLAVQQPHPQGEPVMPVLEIPAELQ